MYTKEFLMNYYLSKVLLFFGLLTASYASLAAGPIYAAKWKRGNQVVCVYGDHHFTHKIFDGQDKLMAQQFIEHLKKSKDEVLLLLEDSCNTLLFDPKIWNSLQVPSG